LGQIGMRPCGAIRRPGEGGPAEARGWAEARQEARRGGPAEVHWAQKAARTPGGPEARRGPSGGPAGGPAVSGGSGHCRRMTENGRLPTLSALFCKLVKIPPFFRSTLPSSGGSPAGYKPPVWVFPHNHQGASARLWQWPSRASRLPEGQGCKKEPKKSLPNVEGGMWHTLSKFALLAVDQVEPPFYF